MGEFIRIDIDGGVATIRIDRPPANALARPVSSELSEAAATVTGDKAVRAVVIWGGEKIFAAGADIKAMVDYGPDEVAEDVGALEQACRDLEAARFAADRGVRWVELKTFAPNRGAMEFWEDLGFTARVVQLTSPTKGLLERLDGR